MESAGKDKESLIADMQGSINQVEGMLRDIEKLKVDAQERQLESVRQQKLSTVDSWRALWAVFMLLIVFPAWLFAGVVEGSGFRASVGLVNSALRGNFPFMPDIVNFCLSWPVAIVAKFIPSSTTWPFLGVGVLGGGFVAIPMIVFAIFFVTRRFPYYKNVKSKIDPYWEQKANEHVVVQAAIRSGPFSTLIVFFVITGLIGSFFVLPNIRLTVADKWSGEVSLVDANGKMYPMDVQLSLDFVDPGKVVDYRPGMHQETLLLKFSGNDVEKLRASGVSDSLFESKLSNTILGQKACAIKKASVVSDAQGFLSIAAHNVRRYSFVTEDVDGGSAGDCPASMHLGVVDFDNAEFAINNLGGKYWIYAKLKRDSRWGWIERFMAESDFYENPGKALDSRALGTPLGYR